MDYSHRPAHRNPLPSKCAATHKLLATRDYQQMLIETGFEATPDSNAKNSVRLSSPTLLTGGRLSRRLT